MFKMKSIGTLYLTGQFTMIEINQKYRKALKNAEEFSHIHVFYLVELENNFCLKRDIVSIKELNQNEGYVKCSPIKELGRKAELIDIKPYLPSEDRVTSAISITNTNPGILPVQLFNNEGKGEYKYALDSIGEIRNVNGKIFIQLHNMMKPKGNFLTILWWFDKFDAEKYRLVTECNPFYENAPRSGRRL